MTWVAVAIGASAAVGAGTSLYAANQQANAAENASQLQYAANQRSAEQYGQTRADLATFMKTGQEANYGLRGLTGLSRVGGKFTFDPNAPLIKPFTLADFQASPGYQFNLQQGEQAINKAAAARGNYYAPQTLQDVSRYSQGLASNEFQQQLMNYYNQQGNVWDRLYGLSGSGQNAAVQTGGFGANAANQMSAGTAQIGQNIMGAGNAQAAGIMGASNAITGGAADITNQIILRDILTRSGYGGNAGSYNTGWNPAWGDIGL